MNYDTELSKYAISQFIKTNNRSPTDLELRRAIATYNKQMPDLIEKGFSGYLVAKPQFSSASSASVENQNRLAILTDSDLAKERILTNVSKLENLFRGIYATSRSLKKKLDQIESRIDNVLLLTGSTDAFVYGVEEDFTTQDLIDFEATDASVESGFVTQGRAGFGLVDLANSKIKFTTVADKGYIGTQNTSDVQALKSDDGSIWEYLVYTSYKQGRVSLIVDIVLDEPQFISECRFYGSTGGQNSTTTITGFYSVDNKTFKAIEPVEVALQKEETVLSIGQHIKTIRLIFSKTSYDAVTAVNNQFVYLFALDSIKIYSRSYSVDAESTVVSGPYDIFDEEGNPVYFTRATADICVTSGDTSSVGLYLSVDGETYLPIDTSSNGTVAFDNNTQEGTEVVVDISVEVGKSVDTLDNLLATEAVLNTAISPDWQDKLIRKSIVIKRNVPAVDANGRITVFNVDTGWAYDAKARLYKTTVYVTNPAGLTIDLGNTSAYVNGIQFTGEILLQQGYSVFETSETNYAVVATGMTKLSDLRKADPLYPYNHKLLVEGYTYSDTFKGDRIYQGVDEYFGALLTYVPIEIFAIPENANNYGIYTLEQLDIGTVFKIKTNKNDSTWPNEISMPTWSVGRGTNNQLWFKMILSSSEENRSAVVTNVRMRVI